MSTSILTSTTITASVDPSASADPLVLSLNAPLPPLFLAYRAEVLRSFSSVFTPLNTGLLIVLISILYVRVIKPFNAANAIPVLSKDSPVVFQTFTPRTLLRFNGTPDKTWNPDAKVYIAVKGKVHDVSAGRNFYGPGGPYENFAGRDATRGLACQSFDEEMLTKNLDGPLDDCKDLTRDQVENLQGWVERFDEKYLVVGKLVAFNDNKNYGH